MGKTLVEGKRVQLDYNWVYLDCLIKTLLRKTQWEKTLVEGKRVQSFSDSSPSKLYDKNFSLCITVCIVFLDDDISTLL